MRRIIFAALSLCLLAGSAFAEHSHPEKYYQAMWCAEQGGQLEVVLPDGSRCDCETAIHMVEFDFDHKWAESVGQALNYAIYRPGKRAGIVLIIEGRDGEAHAARVRTIADHYKLPLDLWTMEADQ